MAKPLTQEQLEWELIALQARVGLLHELANCIVRSIDDLRERALGHKLDSRHIGHFSEGVRELVMSRRGVSSAVAEMIDRGQHPR